MTGSCSACSGVQTFQIQTIFVVTGGTLQRARCDLRTARAELRGKAQGVPRIVGLGCAKAALAERRLRVRNPEEAAHVVRKASPLQVHRPSSVSRGGRISMAGSACASIARWRAVVVACARVQSRGWTQSRERVGVRAGIVLTACHTTAQHGERRARANTRRCVPCRYFLSSLRRPAPWVATRSLALTARHVCPRPTAALRAPLRWTLAPRGGAYSTPVLHVIRQVASAT